MKQVNRIAEGRLIDRDVPITFTFNGRTLQGFRGDTLASALLANGVKIVGRSFKYGRPRGIIAAGVEEPNAILADMEAGLSPDQKARTLTIEDRAQAIKSAFMLAQTGDIILIAGKGHEKYQEIKGERTHFDDVEEVQNFLNN